ncbi:nucleotidyltransferase-like protein [Cohnella caldifontis]|uniref:nucleotidyltransferase-like protein n=1 Tax=Cohnella caldifontis TaxID=3027471 RepID=UPI0023EB20DD|nr:nucleotidyltransferase-like protein [Cohnella sp. YIM B05605]
MNRLDSKEWYFHDLFGREEGVVGLMLIADPYSSMPMIDGTDRLVLVVRDRVLPGEEIEQWMLGDLRVRVRRVTLDTLERWVIGGDRDGVQWLVQGEVLSDEMGRLAELRNRLEEWPDLLREQKLLCEFSRFMLTYSHAKRNLQQGQVLDAYSNVLASLHHWAHISLVEQGMLPELTVWEQMRRVNPGIYKLYEELTTSPETLEKRVQLVVLACEFSVLTKMRTSCALLVHVLASRETPWTVAELQQEDRLRELPIDFSLLMQKLVQRGLVREVAKAARGQGAVKLELRYTAEEEHILP